MLTCNLTQTVTTNGRCDGLLAKQALCRCACHQQELLCLRSQSCQLVRLAVQAQFMLIFGHVQEDELDENLRRLQKDYRACTDSMDVLETYGGGDAAARYIAFRTCAGDFKAANAARGELRDFWDQVVRWHKVCAVRRNL